MASQVDAVSISAPVDHRASVLGIRRAVGALLVLLGFLVMYALAWDSTWHGTVGRDKGFLSPPHALMYGSAATAGVLCVAAVLLETVRFHARAGVDDGNSVRALGLFHAPIGVLLAGFGILTMVLAGPLDNYWHSLYGIFISAWKPFHMMGLIGGAIWGIANLYLWSALLVQARRDGRMARIDTVGFLAAVTVLMRLLMTISYPALTVFQTATVGPVSFMTYPVVLALTTVWLLWVVQRVLQRAHAGALSVFLLLGFHGLIQLTVPWIVRTQAAFEERTFFNPTLIPAFSLDRLAPDAGLLIPALVLSWVARRHFHRSHPAASATPEIRWREFPGGPGPGLATSVTRGGFGDVSRSLEFSASASSYLWTAGQGALLGVAFWVVGAVSSAASARMLSRVVLPPGLSLMPAATMSDATMALPFTVIAAVLSALLGRGISEVLRRNPR